MFQKQLVNAIDERISEPSLFSWRKKEMTMLNK